MMSALPTSRRVAWSNSASAAALTRNTALPSATPSAIAATVASS